MRKMLCLLLALGVFHSVAADAADRRHRRAPRSGRHLRHARGGGGGCQSSPAPAVASFPPHTEPKSRAVDPHFRQSLADDAGRIATSPATMRFNGGTVVITDGYRSCGRNRTTRGSAKNSAHLRGNAIDIRSRDGSSYDYAMAIQAAGLHQPGGYFNTCRPHVHLDVEHTGFVNECGGKGKFGRKRGRKGSRSLRHRSSRRR